ncbi:hypothetical protein Ae406Ps2_6005 [Pseudonocardia sp. Ae406_Ps2]|nr:hypothetical protein Ae406Ps2_6005 [Pseudonocardia sp. Ae406_Ps2]OLM09537.1 hypothetical protein Ae706Ps2_5999c [Pseudonocardia sp. Ae706_Ps2]OLM27856.1 hypothetical protein Ae717Ps2_7074 [Pseudonocardia sp. Ae717_Ps2]
MNRASEHRAPGPLAETGTGRPPAAADDSLRADLLDPCPSCGEPGPHEAGIAPTAAHCRRGICGARWGDHHAASVAAVPRSVLTDT